MKRNTRNKYTWRYASELRARKEFAKFEQHLAQYQAQQAYDHRSYHFDTNGFRCRDFEPLCILCHTQQLWKEVKHNCQLTYAEFHAEADARYYEERRKEGDEYIVTYRDEEQDWPAGKFDTLEKARECSEALTNDGYNAIISRVSRYLDNTNR